MDGFFNILLKYQNFSRKLFSVVILFFAFQCITGQDINYTLYNYNPLFLNPANTGNFYADWRAAANYRSQWGAIGNAYNTASLSFDKPFYLRKQKLGVGLFVVNDNTGIGGLTFNSIFASLGYEKEVAKNFFNAGLQIGYAFGKVNSWNVWDNQAGDFTGTSTESDFGENANYLDINAGLLWKRSIGRYEPEVGVAFAHINSPKKSFYGGSEKETIRSTFHGKVKIEVSDNLYVLPSVLYFNKNGNNLTIPGANIGYGLLGSSYVKEIYAGLYLRNGILDKADAFSVLIGASVLNFDITFGYDKNISQFGKSAGNLGAFEISLIYKSISSVLNTYSIPCERF